MASEKIKPILTGKGIWINRGVRYGNKFEIGHGSCIGFPEPGETSCTIGNNVKIGCFCVVEMGAQLGNYVEMDHYCRVGTKSKVGDNTKLLYGARIHDYVIIGSKCRISGNCPDRVIIEDNVSHFGRIIHEYRDPKVDWDSTNELSPHICEGAVIGANAILIGGIKIGKNCEIRPGEIVKHDIPPDTVFTHGQIFSKSEWKSRKK